MVTTRMMTTRTTRKPCRKKTAEDKKSIAGEARLEQEGQRMKIQEEEQEDVREGRERKGGWEGVPEGNQ